MFSKSSLILDFLENHEMRGSILSMVNEKCCNITSKKVHGEIIIIKRLAFYMHFMVQYFFFLQREKIKF